MPIEHSGRPSASHSDRNRPNAAATVASLLFASITFGTNFGHQCMTGLIGRANAFSRDVVSFHHELLLGFGSRHVADSAQCSVWALASQVIDVDVVP